MKESFSLSEMRGLSSKEIKDIFWDGLSEFYQSAILSYSELGLGTMAEEYFKAAEKSQIKDDEQFISFEYFLDLKLECLGLEDDDDFENY